MRPKHYAAVVFAAVLAVAFFVDLVTQEAHVSAVRADMAAQAESLAADLSDLLARETAAVDTLAAFVEITKGDEDIASEFRRFARPLLEAGETIQSVQLAPDAVIEFAYPLRGNEEAVGLDLLADRDRRRILVPAMATGERVVQGPVELVQGGMGVLVRKAIYNEDGSFYGFAAILLDWDRVMEVSGFAEPPEGTVTGTRVARSERLIAGTQDAFSEDPEVAELTVGATDTVWEVAIRPEGGWPTTAPISPWIWVMAFILATAAGAFVYSLLRRPEVLRLERARVTKELAFAEARYRATFNNVAVGVMITDHEGVILSANPAMHEIAGMRSGELKGEMARSLINPTDLPHLRLGMIRLRKSREPYETEVRLEGEEQRWARVIVTMISGADDDDLFVSIVEDVTERRASEAELAESESKFRQLFEQAPIAIQREDFGEVVAEFDRLRSRGVQDLGSYLAENPGRLPQLLDKVQILDANPAASELQGHLSRPTSSSTLLDRLVEPARESFIETLQAVWEGKPSLGLTVESRARDGSPLHLDVHWSAPLAEGQPDYSKMLVTISDITELREAKRRLEELIESKDRFVASVAHELRTPLTAVVGFAQELKDSQDIYSDREKAEFRELIATHSSELGHIIEDLLVWARGDIGEVKVRPEVVDLSHVVRTALRGLRAVDVIVAEPDSPVVARADPKRLRQIVRNLVTNAIRHGGPRVEVEVRDVDGMGLVEVSDDGDPLSPSDMQRIFEPYARSGNGSMAPGSIGLGLSVSLTLARLQDGDIVCVRQDGRNVFRVSLPLAEDMALANRG